MPNFWQVANMFSFKIGTHNDNRGKNPFPQGIISFGKFKFLSFVVGKSYKGEGSNSIEKLENHCGDQREDSLNSLGTIHK